MKTKPSNIPMNCREIVLHDDLNRFKSYWNQINEIVNLNPSNVLEVGKGTGFVNNYLKSIGIDVTSIDIDTNRKPDIVCDIREFESKIKFHVVCLFEVIEHMPFHNIEPLFQKLNLYSNYIVMSVPVCTKAYRLLAPKIDILLELPLNDHDPVSKWHYWELNKKRKKDLESIFRQSGFEIINGYRYKENAFNYFYVLKTGKS